MYKRLFALAMALAMALLPMGAMAAKKASIRFPAKLGLMVEGDAVTLKPKLKNVKLADVTWATSDGSVVSLSGNVATAVSVGRALVTATGGGASAKLGVVVLPKAIALGVGEKLTLPRGGGERYSMKNKKVATVSSKGVVKAKKKGKATITVITKDGKKKATCKVVVK